MERADSDDVAENVPLGPVAIFDLDGTLVDAAADIAAGVNRLPQERKLRTFPLSCRTYCHP